MVVGSFEGLCIESEQVLLQCSQFSMVVGSFEGLCIEPEQVLLQCSLGVTLCVQLYTCKCIPKRERMVCVAFFYFITLPHGHPYAVFGAHFSISGEWMLFYKELNHQG